MAKVTPVLWTHKTNASGHHPIFLRCADSRRTLYASLGIYIHPRFWNTKQRRVRRGHPNSESINALIQQRLAESEAERIRLLAAGERITAEALKASLRPEQNGGNDFFAFADAYVEDLHRRGQVREHRREKSVLKKLRGFTGTPLPFERFTPRLLRDYETHLIEKHGNAASTVHGNFCVLRTLLYRAIREGLFPQEKNPFFQFTPKQARKPERPKLSLEQVRAIEALDLAVGGPEGSLIARVRDYFLFSLYAAGVRFGDVAEMKRGDIAEVDGEWRLTYTMGKTGKRQSLRLLPQARTIIEPYLVRQDGTPKDAGDLLFPILDGYDVQDPDKRVNAIGSQNALVNKYLKQIAAMIGIELKLSFHIARHSFADIARKAGWDVYAISKALGHSGLNITEKYLAGFDADAVDGKMDSLFEER